MVLVLFAITLVCSAAVGVVYRYTKDPIEAAQSQKKIDAVKAVLPAFTNNPVAEVVEIDGSKVYPAKDAYQNIGYAIESASAGFNGDVKLMIGFDREGNIVDIAILEQAETPGLGANMSTVDNPLIMSFRGKNAGQMTLKVKKDGGDVDALTAATISSRAYTDAVAKAYEVFKKINAQNSAETAAQTEAPQQE